MTASSAAEDPTLEVDAVELLPEVIGASRHFTRSRRRRRASPRLHVDRRRRAPLRARHASGATTSSSPTTSIRRAAARARSTRSSISRPIRDRLARRRAVLPVAAAASARPRHAAEHRPLVRERSIRDGWALLASNSLGTPVIGLVARVDGARFDVAALRHRLAHSRVVEPPTDVRHRRRVSPCSAASSRARRALATVRRRRAAEHRRSSGRRLPRATRHVRAGLAARRSAGRRCSATLSIDPAELVEPPSTPTGRARSPPTGRARALHRGRPRRRARRRRRGDARAGARAAARRPAHQPRLPSGVRPAAADGLGLGASDPDAARTLLAELARIQPARPEARALRDALASATR